MNEYAIFKRTRILAPCWGDLNLGARLPTGDEGSYLRNCQKSLVIVFHVSIVLAVYKSYSLPLGQIWAFYKNLYALVF